MAEIRWGLKKASVVVSFVALFYTIYSKKYNNLLLGFICVVILKSGLPKQIKKRKKNKKKIPPNIFFQNVSGEKNFFLFWPNYAMGLGRTDLLALKYGIIIRQVH